MFNFLIGSVIGFFVGIFYYAYREMRADEMEKTEDDGRGYWDHTV